MTRRVIGLDAGGTKLLAGVVDETGEVLQRSFYSWPSNAGREQVLTIFGEAIDEIVEEVGDVAAVGVGLPATMDLEHRRVVGCRHLPLAGFEFGDWLEEEIDLPVFVDNDATLAMLAEHTRGAALGALDAVLLTIGTGIGGGLVVGGQLVRGLHGAAAEPGHMTIDFDGPPCPGDCPGRGCLEAYVSGPALAHEGMSAGQVLEAARERDADALEALAAMGEKLGVGIASLLNLLDPEIVVIGGGFGSAAAELLVEPAIRVARARALKPAGDDARIVMAALGEDAGMVGAGMLALADGDA